MERGRWKNKWKEPLYGADRFFKISDTLKAVHEECRHAFAVGNSEFCKVGLLRLWNLLKGVSELSFWNSLCEVPFSFEKNKIGPNPLHSRIKHEGGFS